MKPAHRWSSSCIASASCSTWDSRTRSTATPPFWYVGSASVRPLAWKAPRTGSSASVPRVIHTSFSRGAAAHAGVAHASHTATELQVLGFMWASPRRVLEQEAWSDDWNVAARLAGLKFLSTPDLGGACLQGRHGNREVLQRRRVPGERHPVIV